MADETKLNSVRKQIQAQIDQLFARIGKLTKIQRLIICLVTFALIGGGYYYFIFAPKSEELKTVRTDLKTQKEKLRNYKIKARSLKKFEKKMAQAQEEFDKAMKALPDKKEVPSLLVGVSKAGQNAGLEFLLFQPESVVNREFYKEIPLSMVVSGKYHQVADFFFQVAGLNRIVNIKNMSMAIDGKNKGRVEMKCSAETYMFAEEPAQKKGKKRKKKR